MNNNKDEKYTGLNRRDFLKMAGVGAAALAVPGMGFAANAGQKPMSDITQGEIETDVLVIGGGYAGVFAAIKAKEKGVDVTLVEKGTIFKSGLTPFARGFAYFDHATQDEDVLYKYSNIVGEYLANMPYMKMWVDDSKAIFDEMTSWGFFKSYSRFVDIMRDQVIKKGVKVIERTMITNLIKQKGRVAGAVGFHADEDKALVIKAKAVVSCAGAGAFKTPGYFTNSITSDSDAMAYRIGAEITGKEFQDTHGTKSDFPAAGYENWKHEIEGTNPCAMKAVLDGNLILSASLTAHTEGGPIVRGARPSGDRPSGDRPSGGRPSGKRPSMEGGGLDSADPGGGIKWGSPFDNKHIRDPSLPSMTPSKATGAQTGGASAGLAPHKCEGIWPSDDNCQSNIPGLFAAGDALGSAMGGGTYTLGGGSSSASAVQGAKAGAYAAEFAKKNKMLNVSKNEIAKIKTEIFAPRAREKGYSPDWMIQLIQGTMIPYYVLYVKKEDRLKAALTNVMFFQEHFAPNLMATDTHDLRLAHEVKNMLLNAEMKLRASLFRTESRANHYREDYPARDDGNWLARVVISNDNGKMKLKKVPVADEVKPDPSTPYEERYPNRYPGELDYLKSKNRV